MLFAITWVCFGLGCVCHALGHRSMNLIAISSCPSSLFSTSYLRANIPSAVPLPCLNSSCSSPIPLTLQRLFCHPRFFPETSTYGLAPLFILGHAHLPFFSIFGLSAPFFIPLSLAGVQQLICRSYSNSLSHSHHFYSHFINACSSFRLGLQDKQ